MRSVAVLCGLLGVGCLAEQGGTIVITGIAKPDRECSISATGQHRLSGETFDAAGGSEYLISPIVRNDMVDEIDNELPVDKDVVLTGFRVCWFDVLPLSGRNAFDLECDELPSTQRAFVPVSGVVEANMGLSAVTIGVLGPEAFAALWPDGIPASATLVVQLQAEASLKSGEGVVTSNWYPFELEVCERCILRNLESSCGVGCIDYVKSCRPNQSGGTPLCRTNDAACGS